MSGESTAVDVASDPSREPMADPPNSNSDSEEEKQEEEEEQEEEEKPQVTFKELFRYADGIDIFLMVVGVIGALGSGAGLPAFAYYMASMVDELAGDPNDMEDTVSDLALKMTYVGIGVFVGTFFYVSFWMIAASRQASRIRIMFFNSILRQEIGWHDEHKPGELTARLLGDIRVIQNGMNDKFSACLSFLGMGVFGMLFGFLMSWRLTLVILATFPLFLSYGIVLEYVTATMSRESRKAYAKAGELSTEALENIRTVQTFGGEESEVNKFSDELAPAMAAGKKKEFLGNGGIGFTYIVFYLTITIAFWYGSKLVKEKKNTAGDILGVFFSVVIGAMGIGMMFPGLQALAEAAGAAYEVYNIIDRVPLISNVNKGVTLPRVEGGISFQNVDFAYPARESQNVFSKLCIDIKPGTTVAFSGSSGCGKSTVVALIQRFYDPQEGQVCIDGKDVRDLDLDWWRSQIGTVSQEPSLFTGSVADNVRVGKADATLEEVQEACKQADVHEFIMSLPEEYETDVGSVGSRLSGGQKQRMAIARALIKSPSILLLDEATSALDRQSEAEVQAALDRAMVKPDGTRRTVVVVAHRLTTIRNADRIYYIEPRDTGSIITEQGTFDELMNRKGRFALMAATQVRIGESLLTPDASPTVAGETKKLDTAVASTTKNTLEDEAAAFNESAEREQTEWEEANEDSVFSRVFEMTKDHMGSVILGFCGSVLSGWGYPTYAIVMGKILTLFAENADDPDKITDKTPFWACMFTVIGVVVFVGWTLQGFYGVAGEAVTMIVRKQLFGNILRQDMSFFDAPGRDFGTLSGRLSGDAEAVHQLWGPSIGLKIQMGCNILGGFIVGMIWSWRCALVAACGIPLMCLGGAAMMIGSTGMEQTVDEKKGGAKVQTQDSVAAESITNIRTVVAFGIGDKLVDTYVSKTVLTRSSSHNLMLLMGVLNGIGQFSLYGVQALVFWYGAKLITQGKEDFDFVHESLDTHWDLSPVVVFELLAVRRGSTDQGSSAHPQVRTGIEKFLVNQEVLLFGAQRRGNRRG